MPWPPLLLSLPPASSSVRISADVIVVPASAMQSPPRTQPYPDRPARVKLLLVVLLLDLGIYDTDVVGRYIWCRFFGGGNGAVYYMCEQQEN